MSRLYKIYTTAILGLASLTVWAGHSILDIKHSITDDNIVPPESFETEARKLEESFFFKHYTVPSVDNPKHYSGNAKEYEEFLAKLPVEIEMPYNPVVGKYIDMYLERKRPLVSDMLALHNYYSKFFIEELIKEGLPLELQYLPVIESAINPNAVSRAGATGLWQFMGPTAKGLGMEVNSLVDERRDPRVSSRYAAKYLKQLHAIYGDWSLAIAAYNCGPGNVNKALRRAGGGKLDFWEIYNYLPTETRGYVPLFIAANYVMNYHGRYGINPTVVKQQLVTDTVQVNERVHFNQIAEVLQIPIEEIRMLNPQFRKDIIPGDHHPYMLTLPSQKALSYTVSEDAILAYEADKYRNRTTVEIGRSSKATSEQNEELMAGQSKNAEENKEIAEAVTDKMEEVTHIVGRGESLRDIAKHYGVSSTDVKRWNNLRRGKVKEGDKIIVKVYRRDVAGASTKPSTESTVTERKTSSALAQTTKSLTKKSSYDNNSRRQSKTSSGKKKDIKPKTTRYKVKSGDTLEKIARKHGTTVSAIQKANGMSRGTTRLNIGQTLNIPSKSSVKSGGKKSTYKSKAGKKSGSSKKKSRSRKRR